MLVKPGSTVIKMGSASSDGYLWLRDAFDQTWRYAVDPIYLQNIHAEAFGAWYPGKLESEPCRMLNCSKELPVRKQADSPASGIAQD
jgi:hypothetical protein